MLTDMYIYDIIINNSGVLLTKGKRVKILKFSFVGWIVLYGMGVLLAALAIFLATVPNAGANRLPCQETVPWNVLVDELIASKGFLECSKTASFQGAEIQGIAWQPWMTTDGIVRAMRADIAEGPFLGGTTTVIVQTKPTTAIPISFQIWEQFLEKSPLVTFTGPVELVSLARDTQGNLTSVYVMIDVQEVLTIPSP